MANVTDAMKSFILEKLAEAGAKGAKPPFGLRGKAPKEAATKTLGDLCDEGVVQVLKVGVQTRYVLADAKADPEALLAALDKAAQKGATVATLAKRLKVGGVQVERGLEPLLRQGSACALPKGRVQWWYATAHAPPKAETTLAHEFAGGELFDEADAKAVWPKGDDRDIATVLSALAAKGALEQLAHVKRKAKGKRADAKMFWRYRPQAAPALQESPAPSPAPQAPDPAQGARIQAAYDRLRRGSGGDFVQISALAHESGVALEAVKQWITSQAKAGHAALTGTNLAAMGEHARHAAVAWEGELCLLVKLGGPRHEPL